MKSSHLATVPLLALTLAGTEAQVRDPCTDSRAAGLSEACMAALDQRHLDEDVRHSRPPKAAGASRFPRVP